MNDPVSGDGGLTDAALDKWVADAEAQAARYQQLTSVVDRVQVTESSSDNLVTVTVNAGGTVTDLRIADRAMTGPGAKLAERILVVMRKAQARIAGRVAEIMQATVGDDQTVVNAVLAEYHHKFPEPATEPSVTVAVQDIGASNEPTTPPTPVRTPRPVPRRSTGLGGDERWNDDGGAILEEVDK